MGIPLPRPQMGGGPPKFLAHVYCDQTAGWMKLILGMVVSLSPGEFVLDGDPAPSPIRGRTSSPILMVEVENFEIGPEVGALPVIANVVALEQQRILAFGRAAITLGIGPHSSSRLFLYQFLSYALLTFGE